MNLLERERRTLERLYEMEREAVNVAGDVHFIFAQYTQKVRQNGVKKSLKTIP
jgi:hypothetical protein